MLLGREQERDEIDRALARARSGSSATLALVGCDHGKPAAFQGWIEANLIFAAAVLPSDSAAANVTQPSTIGIRLN